MKSIYTLITLLCTMISTNLFAQTDIDELYKKYSEKEDITSVYISETMLSLGMNIAETDINNVNISGIAKKLTGLYILSIESSKSKIFSEFKSDINKLNKSGYETLMKVREGGKDGVDILIKKGKEKGSYSNIIMVANGKDDIALIFFKGNNITDEDIKKLCKEHE